jgi:hypothetical protein
MSFIDTDGRSGRFLTLAQNRVINSESAPRSSKKWLAAEISWPPTMSASNWAKACIVGDGAT